MIDSEEPLLRCRQQLGSSLPMLMLANCCIWRMSACMAPLIKRLDSRSASISTAQVAQRDSATQSAEHSDTANCKSKCRRRKQPDGVIPKAPISAPSTMFSL